jgi:hypothetical protein
MRLPSIYLKLISRVTGFSLQFLLRSWYPLPPQRRFRRYDDAMARSWTEVIGSTLGVGAMGPHQACGKTMEHRRPEGEGDDVPWSSQGLDGAIAPTPRVDSYHPPEVSRVFRSVSRALGRCGPIARKF